MKRREDLTLLISGILVVLAALLVITLEPRFSPPSLPPEPTAMPTLLTDPFLQLPTSNSVQVVWFTEFEGQEHSVIVGQRPGVPLDEEMVRRVPASSRLLSRLREDQESKLPGGETLEQPTFRPIWRHEATITNIIPGQRFPYRVESIMDDGAAISSDVFSLAAVPPSGQPLTILLTSDHQSKPMTAANLQKVEETVGRVDAIFLAGDLVNVPDRASEWFDDAAGAAFFPALQGRGSYQLTANGRTERYQGGAFIQNAPLFPAVGNHEVMGRYSPTAPLNQQYNDPVPRQAAATLYETQPELFNPKGDPKIRQKWVVNNSFNFETVRELFTLPGTQIPQSDDAPPDHPGYYATTFGDVRLVSLFVANIWRLPMVEPGVQGRFQERLGDLNNPAAWGHGQHIFEPIREGSPQYQWLQAELASEAFQQAPYKIVMFHHPPHSLGDNVVPPFTDPVVLYDRHEDGTLRSIRYEYPIQNDYLIRDLVPLLEEAGVDLVFYGHSHLWNRFVGPTGLHFLESSNVGNTYGAFWQGNQRLTPPAEASDSFDKYQQAYYVAEGDPNGLEPVMPTLAPLTDEQGTPLPYIASNDITAFTIFETATGTVSSYYFDTRDPNSEVIKFDEFTLDRAS